MRINALYVAIANEVFLEFRRASAIGGLIAFVLSTSYIVFISLSDIPADVWGALFWIAFLFMAIHSVLKSFTVESKRRFLYYYMLFSPIELFLAKSIYNSILLFILGALMFFALLLVAGSPVVHYLIFVLALALGSVSISLTFTFISAIAIKGDNSATLMTIMSFPLIIPILLHVIKLTQVAVVEERLVNYADNVLTLAGIDALILGLGLLLFPYLWKS